MMIPAWKLSRRFVLVPLLLCFCSGWSAGAVDNHGADAGIHKFVNTYFDSWSKADFPLYRSLFRGSASIAVLEGDQWRPWDLSQFLDDQERVQSQRKMEEIPLSIDIKASSSKAAFVEVSWRLNRAPENSVTGKDWFTLVKEGEDWKILNLTFWQDAPAESSASVPAPAEGPAATKPKIVVSGFEQFGGRSINASTIWIAFGEGTSGFQIETVARNTRGRYRDNKNEVPAEKEIDPNGVQQLKLDFPAEALSNRLRNLGYDCTLSSDAGKYLCEEMLYSLLEEKNSSNAKLKHALFIHVPVHGSTVRVRGKEVPLSDDNLRVAAHDLFEAIAAVLEIPAPK